jgi:hypothetical protein
MLGKLSKGTSSRFGDKGGLENEKASQGHVVKRLQILKQILN